MANKHTSAAQRFGYLWWPKILHDECYGDAELGRKLEAGAGEGEYGSAVRSMRESVISTISSLKDRNIGTVRLGVSWADADSPGGWQWIGWYLREFHEAGFDILPCLNYTPIHLAEARLERIKEESADDPARFEEFSKWRASTCIPPYPLDEFASFVKRFLAAYGRYLGAYVQLWNEPNLYTDWADGIDTTGKMFADMIRPASQEARAAGFKVLGGGLTKYHESIAWLRRTCPHGILDDFDAVGLHGNRGTWSDKSVLPSWPERIREFKALMAEYTDRDIPIVIDEAGFTTVDLELEMGQDELEEIQVAIFADLMQVIEEGHVERVYWYTTDDAIFESVRFLTTGWEDILQFFFGDTDLAGNKKLLRRLLEEGGPAHVLEYAKRRNLLPLVNTVIDRGDPSPATWPKERIERVLAEMRARAEDRKSETQEFRQAA